MNNLTQSQVSGYDAVMAMVTATLRTALKQCGKSRYRVSKDTGITEATLSRFVMCEIPLRGKNMDTLCNYLGLELTKITGKAQNVR
jgi:hypothetical protein